MLKQLERMANLPFAMPNIPGAIPLRCLKHIKDSIERKVNDLKFNSQSICVVLADIFGTVVDGIRELGLSDATDQEHFFPS